MLGRGRGLELEGEREEYRRLEAEQGGWADAGAADNIPYLSLGVIALLLLYR